MEVKGKLSVGRPLEDLSSLPENWYHEVLNLYKEGAKDVEVKALIWEWRGSFSNDLWDRWRSEEPEFSETIKTGLILSESWWVKNGRTNLTNREFNYTGWYMNMKNRFGWADKHEVESNNKTTGHITTSEPLTLEQWELMGKESLKNQNHALDVLIGAKE